MAQGLSTVASSSELTFAGPIVVVFLLAICTLAVVVLAIIPPPPVIGETLFLIFAILTLLLLIAFDANKLTSGFTVVVLFKEGPGGIVLESEDEDEGMT